MSTNDKGNIEVFLMCRALDAVYSTLAKPALPPPTVFRIRKTVRTDEIGHDCGWSMWECEVEMSDGTFREGMVQGDEHSTAEETLEFTDE